MKKLTAILAQKATQAILERLKVELNPTLYYHSYLRTLDVMATAKRLSSELNVSTDEARLVQIAAAYQDSGFLESYRNHEAESCLIAREMLSKIGLATKHIQVIESMIMATGYPQTPKTELEKILCDSDLDFLGRDDFEEVSQKFVQELREWNILQTETEWFNFQLEVLTNHHYWTEISRVNRKPNKAKTLKKLRAKVRALKKLTTKQELTKPKRISSIDNENINAWKLNRDYPSKSIELALKTLEQSIARKYDYGKAEACHIIGSANGWMNKYEQGLSFTERAAKIHLKNGFKSESARAKMSVGVINYYRADYQSALRHYTESLNLYLANGDKSGEAEANQGLGSIYTELGDSDQAWACLNKSLQLADKLKSEELKLKTLLVMAKLSNTEGHYDQAIKHYSESQTLAESLNQLQNVTYALQGLGNSYLKKGALDQAEAHLLKCLEIRLEIAFKAGEARTHQTLGETYLKQGKFDAAKVQLSEALKMASEGDRKGVMMKTHKTFAEVYKLEQNFDQFAFHLEKFQEISSEIDVHYKVRRQNFELEQNYQNTRTLSEIGQDIISSLDIEKVLFTIYEKVNKLMDASIFGIGLLNSKNEAIDYKLAISNGVRYASYSRDLKDKNQLPVWCVDHKSPVFINDVQNEAPTYISAPDQKQFIMKDGSIAKQREQSVLYIPILSGTEILGIITVQSYARHAYTLYHLEILRNVATYASIALINIGLYQRLENEVTLRTAELTKTKERSDQLLLNILPKEIAEELKFKGYTTVRRYEKATILFMDIVGFSTISEGLSPKQLVAEIDTYFSAFDTIMDNVGMEKIKTIGDAYIAAAGLPRGNEASALTVVKAAFDILAKVKELRQEREGLNASFFEFRIGINTGPVVAGVVGSKKFQYDIWGDAVNMAARMEQNSAAGKINISKPTYDLVKDEITCTYRGKVYAKNKGEIDMYFVDSLKNNAL